MAATYFLICSFLITAASSPIGIIAVASQRFAHWDKIRDFDYKSI